MKTRSLVALSSLLITLISSTASPLALYQDGVIPYIGVDAQLHYMEFKRNFGKNEFRRKYYKQGNAFVGLKINQYFGFEVGYFRSLATRSNSIATQDILMGVVLDPDDIFISNNKVLLKGFNVNLVGFWPLNDCNALLGSVGFSRTKLDAVHQQTGDQVGHFPQDELSIHRRDFSSKKYTALLRGGIQHYFTKNLSIRAILGWENTARFKNIAPLQQPSELRIRLKDSYLLSLGMIFHF